MNTQPPSTPVVQQAGVPSERSSKFSPVLSSTDKEESGGFQGLVVGLAVGVVVTVMVLVAAMFLFSSESAPQVASSLPAPEVALPLKVVSPKSAEVSAPTESKVVPVVPAAEPLAPSPPPNEVLSATVDTAPSLVYRWQVGKQYLYDFSLTAKPPQGEQIIKGQCTYRVTKIVTDDETKDEPHGTGTAFIVSPDGYLVTCAHVVQDAQRVTVKLGEQQWDADVVAYEPLQDLALLKINAKNLTAIPLAYDSQIELAQTVRVIGYPLTHMLGKGIKITSGSVAGLVETDDENARRFQVDAIINPGNSGGPLIDDRGRVVGVASALLYGFQISEVGFAIPMDEVKKLLDRSKVVPTKLADGQSLSGPELARRVVPSVALVEVYLAPAAYQKYHVEYDFHITENRFIPSANLMPHDRAMAMREAQIANDLKGWFDINRSGEIFAYEGEGNLPFDHVQVGQLIIESLNHDGKSTWASFNGSTLTVNEDPTPVGPHGFPHPIMTPSPFHREEPKQKTYRGIEECEYKIESEVDHLYTIKKTYTYCTLGDEKPPYMEQKGSGTFVFDRQIGLPVNLSFEAVTHRRGVNDQIMTTPYTLGYQIRASATEQAAEKQPSKLFQDYFFELGRQVSQRTNKRGRATRMDPSSWPGASGLATESNASPERLNQLIEILDPRSSSRGRHMRNSVLSSHLLMELADQSVNSDKQEQVAKIFLHYAFKGDSFDKRSAIHGLDRWGTKKQVPQLIDLLTTEIKDIDWPERQDIIQILGRYSQPDVYEAVASRLPYSPEDHDAERVLIQFGAPAESAVIPFLTSLSEDARGSAADILTKIGTPRSVSPLEKAITAEPDHFTKRDMERALETIKQRHRREPIYQRPPRRP